ncbi:protein PRR14L isoform X2 [Lacerta agilis]|uniref:protein PRR14L isoform X2 n=1 Tax=Lacerta agilis TaxID=80427 RepID=UPI00141A3482|nr:protein PRR14L isoform X2 [Lacerta agilis]
MVAQVDCPDEEAARPIEMQGRERRDVGGSGDGCGLRSSAQVAGPTVLMLTASVESLEKSHFNLLSSSMSAVVQELYTSLPVTLSTDLAALSDPTIALDAKPEASTFVLSCSSLSSKPHRTHGLKICSQDSAERLDCTGKASCPGLMDLLPQEPAEARDLAEGDDTPKKDVMELDPCHQHSREDTGGTKELGSVAEEEGLAQSYLASKEICCLREEPWLTHMGRGFLPSPSNVEAAGLQKNPEESQANVQVTPENLSNLLQEAQGMKAKGTDGLFSHAGERSAREVAGVPPESSESSEVDTVMAKVEVSGSNTLVSLESVSAKNDASARELLQEDKEEENCQALISHVALSATKCILPSSGAAGEKSLNRDAEANPILDSDPASMQDKTNLPNDSSSSPVLQSGTTIAAQLSNSAPEASGHHLEGNLELGNILWEENMDAFELVCEMQEEDLRSCEKIELLEEWASEPDTDETLSPVCSSEEMSSESNQEQEVDAQNMDHSYSLTCEAAVEIQKGGAVQCYWKDIQENSQPRENSFAESSSVAKNTFPSSPAHPEDGLRLASIEVDSIQKDKHNQCASSDISMAAGGEENRSLMVEVGNVGCIQNSCSTSNDSNPTCRDSLDCGSRLGEHVPQMGSHSGPKTEIQKSPSTIHLCATTIADVDSEEKPSTVQLCDNYSSAQQTERNLNSTGSLDSLPREEFPAELKLQSASFVLHTKKESPSPSQNAGSCITTREASMKSTGLVLKDTAQKPADQEMAQIEAYSPGNPCMDDLSSAIETCCTSSGGICLAANDDVDGNSVLKSRSEECDGLKASHSSASAGEGVPPEEPGSVVKTGDPHPCDDSDDAGRIWDAACPEASDVAAGNQRSDGNDISVKSHVALEVDTSVFPADSNPELGKASLVAESDGMGAAESVKTCGESWRNGIDEKLADYRDFGKANCLELGKLVQDKGEEKQRQHQDHHSSSSFAPEPSSMKIAMHSNFPGHTDQQPDFLPLEDLCADNPGQPGKTICQTKVQPFPHQNPPFNRLVLLNQKNESPENDVSECQQPPLMSSEKQKVDHALQAVTSSEDTEKSVDCNRNNSLCSERGHGKAPVPLLLIEEKSVQETFQQTTLGSCSSVKMVSESLGDPLKEESIELKSVDSHSECCSELLRSIGFVNDQASQATTDESASGAVSRSPCEVLDEKAFLQCSSRPASSPSQMFFQRNSVNCQKSMEGGCSKPLENKEVPTLASICFGVQLAQNPAICLSQKDDPWTSLSFYPRSRCCPFPKEHPGTMSFSLSRLCYHHVNLLNSENEEASCPVKEITPRDSPLDSKEMSVCAVGTKRRAEVVKDIPVISDSPDPSKKMKQSLEGNQRALNLPTEKTEVTVYPLGIKDSSGALLQGLRFSAGREEIVFPFKIEIHTQPSFVPLPEHILQLSRLLDNPRLRRIRDPSKPTVVARRHLKNVHYALQTKCLLSTRLSPEIFCSSLLPCPSSGGHKLEASPKCLSSQGRSWQAAEVTQEPAGDGKKPLEDLLVIEIPVEKARDSESGVCLMLTHKPLQAEAEEVPALPVASCGAVVQGERAKVKVKSRNLLKRRFFCLAPPLSSSYHAFASGSGVEVSENGSPGSTFRGWKRPKRAEDFDGLDYLEAKSQSLGSLRSQSRPSATNDSPVLVVFCMLPQAFHFSYDGSRSSLRCTRRIRSPLPFRRQLGKACVKISRPDQLRTARRSHLMAGSVSFRNPSAIVLKPECQLTDSVCFAPKLTVTRNKGEGTVRDQMPKRQGSQSSLLDSPRLSKLTKDPALLRKLSALANKLLALPGNPQKRNQLLGSTELLSVPEKYSHFRHKKLLEVFSCVDLKLNSPWFKGSSCGFKMFTSQSLALYPLELTNLFFLELGNNNSPLAFSAPVFPVTFHIKLDSCPARNLPGLTALHNDPSNSHRLALGEAHGFQPSKWTFSFLLPQSCLGVAPAQRDAWAPAESHTATPLASLSAAKSWQSEAITTQRRRAGCPPFGLHTVLALYSPGCYRIWTRRRSLTSRLPAVQNLAALQLAQGLKGLRHSASASADLFSSLPYSLGRVLSIWSQHGPPNRPSEFTPLHSKRCKWRPATSATTRLGFGNSSAMLPQVPDQCVDDPSTVADDSVRLEPSFSASLRASCSLLEPAHPPLGLPVPAFPVLPLDELDIPVPVLPKTGSQLEKAELEKRPKKVSQIRIRKTIPKPDQNLTPMGLPRPKRLKKTEFSLEEIYTNKNYKSPPTTRCLETIFEEPKEKNGSLISVSQQKRKRILEFQDFTIPRKRRARSRVKMMGGSTRAQKAALGGRELDVLLIQKLTDLESFFAKEEEQEQASGS